MARREVIEYPDARLRARAAPVAAFDAELRALVDDLVDTLHGTRALALCAPQVGDLRAVLAMDLSEDRTSPEVYVNPRVVARAAFGLVEERCLSVPGAVAFGLRATRVQVAALDADGAPFERTLEGLHAVCLQHEMDHFEGKLLVDRLFPLARLRLEIAARRRPAPA